MRRRVTREDAPQPLRLSHTDVSLLLEIGAGLVGCDRAADIELRNALQETTWIVHRGELLATTSLRDLAQRVHNKRVAAQEVRARHTELLDALKIIIGRLPPKAVAGSES